MVERQDIDALLISALYGELTPSEETRLAAHLDSHPGDKTALADLTHARGLVRESRLFQVQMEPPQSISTLLMKEATRCAPKPEVQEGWFARFVRSFAAHPAMAAAAMLVIVLGVATFVTKRSGDQFAESTAPSSQSVIQEQTKAGDSPVAMNYASPSGAAMGSGSASVATGGSAREDDAKVGALESANGDSFRVALDEGASEGKDNAALADKKLDEKQKVDRVVTKPTVDPGFSTKLAKEQESLKSAQQQLAAKKTPQRGLELRSPEAAPKDFDEDSRRKGNTPALNAEAKPDPKSATKNEIAFGDSNDVTVDGRVTTDSSKPATGAASGAGNAGAPGGATNRRVQDATPSPAPTTTAPTTTVTTTRPATPRNASPPPPPAAPKPGTEPRRDTAQKTPPAKTVDRGATARTAGPADDKAADPQLAWARDQHAALIAQVRAGECKKAAGIATAISNRAPTYYQQNVETDRAVKACIAYINSERERDAEQRSERARANQKRSNNEPAPAKAAPSKPAAADAATSTK